MVDLANEIFWGKWFAQKAFHPREFFPIYNPVCISVSSDDDDRRNLFWLNGYGEKMKERIAGHGRHIVVAENEGVVLNIVNIV